MNSNQKSQEKKSRSCQILPMFVLAMGLAGCASQSTGGGTPLPNVQTDVPQELSLKKDRSELNELRKDIPEEKQQENDELALILGLMEKPDQEPSRIREKFYDLTSKRREKFNDQTRKEREEYNKAEKKNRDAFLKKLNDERAEFNNHKHTRSEIQDFSTQQEQRRKDYFSDEREHRSDFESQMREKRSNFDDYMRERTQTFNAKYREYSAQYYENQKAMALKKQMEEKQMRHSRTSTAPGPMIGDPPSNVDPADLKSFENIPPGKGVELGN